MREISIYYAYDDTEFLNRDDCLAYEGKAYNLMRSIEKKFSFFDKNMKEIIAPLESYNVEDWLEWLDNAYQFCVYVKKSGSLTDDEAAIIRENIGSCLYNEDFSCATGLFKWEETLGWWVKVDAL